MYNPRLSKFSDEVLLDLIQEMDDRSAFTELYNRYWEVLIDSCYQRLKSVEIAEEIVQEVFVDLFVRRKEIRLKSTVAAYLKTAVKYKVFNVYRSQQVHSQYVANELLQQNVYAPGPDEELQKRELNKMILQATDKMPEKCKEVFLLSRYENLSNKDISEQLGISVSTVKKHITKATHILRAGLSKHTPDFLLLILLLFFS